MRPIRFLKNICLVKQRQGPCKTGVELGGQCDEVHRCTDTERSHPGAQGEQAHIGSAGDHAKEWRHDQDSGTELFDAAGRFDEPGT